MKNSTQSTDQSQSQIIAIQWPLEKRQTNHDRQQYTSHRPESIRDHSLPMTPREKATSHDRQYTSHRPESITDHSYQWHQEKRQTNHDRQQYTSHRPESITDHSLPMTPREKANKPWQTVHKPQTRVKQSNKLRLPQQGDKMLDRMH